MPRFSDRPQLTPPDVPDDASIAISFDGDLVAVYSPPELAAARTERTSDFHCVTGWSVRGLRWEGVPLCDLVALSDAPAFARVAAHDGAVAVFVTEDLLDGQTLLATHLGGEPLGQRHGAPVRLVTPHQYGYKNIKHVRSIDFVTNQPRSELGPKEHLRARVDLEERHARLPNWLIRLPYRLMIPVTATVAERSLRAGDRGRQPSVA